MKGDNFDVCVEHIFKEEGGFVNDARDPGGATNRGITYRTLAAWRGAPVTVADVRALTKKEAADIYRKNYWLAAGCHILPIGVDLAIFDPSVNAGVSRGVKWRNATVTITDPVERVKAISAARRSFYRSLRTFGTFGKGWLARVARVEAAAVRMALEGVGVKPGAVQSELTGNATKAATKAKTATKQAGGTVVAGGGAATAAPTGHLSLWIVCALAAVAVAVLIILINRARAHRILSDAYTDEAIKVGIKNQGAAA